MRTPCAHAAPVAPPQGEDPARRAFREGTEAAGTERWADSERAFRRAFELSHAASALFNQAVALRALGRHLAACRAFERLLADYPDLSAGLRGPAEKLQRESRTRVGTLELQGLALTAHAITVDGQRIEDSLQRPLRIELDEGSHELRISRPAHELFTSRQELRGGEQRQVRVALVTSKPQVQEAPRSHSRLWWWVGGAATVVATGAVAAILVQQSQQGDKPVKPQTSNVYKAP